MARLTLHFTTDLGAQVSVEVNEEELLETLRRYGEKGWFSGELPPGGLILAGYGDGEFDWSLLGGRRLSDETVWCRGFEWRRRERQGEVLYLRPARASDPKERRYVLENHSEYVILAVFPKAAVTEAIPEVDEPPPPFEAAAPEVEEALREAVTTEAEEAPPLDERVVKMRENIGKLLNELEGKGKLEEAQEVMDRHGYSQAETEDIVLGRQVYKELRTLLR